MNQSKVPTTPNSFVKLAVCSFVWQVEVVSTHPGGLTSQGRLHIDDWYNAGIVPVLL